VIRATQYTDIEQRLTDSLESARQGQRLAQSRPVEEARSQDLAVVQRAQIEL
jgi:hypothetical protein